MAWESSLSARRGGADCLVLGVMSGTSLDGVDLALVELSGTGADLKLKRLVSFETTPFDPEFVSRVRRTIGGEIDGRETLASICNLNTEWSVTVARMIDVFFTRVLPVVGAERKDVVIASHGQTIWHNSGISTLQIGDGEVLAQLTGCVVVSNFRAADVAAGGTGAPLVPFFDAILSRLMDPSSKELDATVAFQNLGGIGNVSLIGAAKGGAVKAFDTGPANSLTNEIIAQVCASFTSDVVVAEVSKLKEEGCPDTLMLSECDHDGWYSSRGSVKEDLLESWMAHPFISLTLPKSTGREDFGHQFVTQMLQTYGMFDGTMFTQEKAALLCDLCRTAIRFCGECIGDSYARYSSMFPSVVVLSGGGSHHPLMVNDISSACRRRKSSCSVWTLDEFSSRVLGSFIEACDPPVQLVDAKEGIAFAILGHEKINQAAGLPCSHTNVPSVTGAKRGVTLGQVSIP